MLPSDRAQAFLNGLSVGGAAWFIRGLLVFCLAGAALAVHARLTFRGLDRPAAMEQAEIARALASGRSFVTRTVRPFDLYRLSSTGHATDLEHVPVTRFAPLYPALLSVFLPASAPTPIPGHVYRPEWRIVTVGAVLTLLTAGLVFLLGRALFATRTGLWAGVVYFVSDAVLRAATSGLALPLLTCLGALAALLTVLALHRQERGAPAWRWLLLLAAAGAASGLAVLSAYMMVLFAALLAVYIGVEFRQSRAASVPVFLVGVLLVAAPWGLHNHRSTGSACGLAPYSVLNNSPVCADRSLERRVAPALPGARAWRGVRHKLLAGLGAQVGTGLAAMGGLSAALFLVALFHVFRQTGAQSLKWFAAVGLVLFSAGAALTDGDTSGLHAGLSLLPVVTVLGIAGLEAILEREEVFMPYWQAAATALLIALAATPLAARLAGPGTQPYPPYYPPLPSYVSRLMLPGEALCADIPEAVAWYGNCTAVLVPETLTGLETLCADYPDINAVYLTSVTGNRAFTRELVDGRWAEWLPILQYRYPAAFPFPHAVALPPGTHDQLFLTDRARWQTGVGDGKPDGNGQAAGD